MDLYDPRALDRFTNKAGDTTITDFGPNTVTTRTGAAAAPYMAGYAPDPTPSPEYIARYSAPPPPVYDRSALPQGGASAPPVYDRRALLRGDTGPHDVDSNRGPKMGYADRRALIGSMGFGGRAADALTRGAYRAGAAGSPAAVAEYAYAATPQGVAQSGQLAGIYAREAGDTARQEAAFRNQAFIEEAKHRYGLEAEERKFGRGLMEKTGYEKPQDALGYLKKLSEAELATKRLGGLKTGYDVAQAERDAEARARGELTDTERAQRETQLTVQGAARAIPGETPEQTQARLRGEAETKAAQGKATLKKTEVETTRGERPRDEDVLDQLLEKAYDGDFAVAQKYNRMQQRIVESRGGVYMGTGAMPETPEAWKKKYPGRELPGAKPSPKETPGAPAQAKEAIPGYTPGKVYVQNGRRYRYDGGKDFTEVK